jgi:hypothetical protein
MRYGLALAATIVFIQSLPARGDQANAAKIAGALGVEPPMSRAEQSYEPLLACRASLSLATPTFPLLRAEAGLDGSEPLLFASLVELNGRKGFLVYEADRATFYPIPKKGSASLWILSSPNGNPGAILYGPNKLGIAPENVNWLNHAQALAVLENSQESFEILDGEKLPWQTALAAVRTDIQVAFREMTDMLVALHSPQTMSLPNGIKDVVEFAEMWKTDKLKNQLALLQCLDGVQNDPEIQASAKRLASKLGMPQQSTEFLPPEIRQDLIPIKMLPQQGLDLMPEGGPFPSKIMRGLVPK